MRVALVGFSHSGKTSLAKALRTEGWYYANYTDLLKELAAVALTAIDRRMIPDEFGIFEHTVSDIVARKTELRPFINELGTALGFDRGYGIENILAKWAAKGSPEPIVWDCVRFEAQAAKLHALGFLTVKLDVPYEMLRHRALNSGVTREEFERQFEWDHKNLPEADIYLNGERPTSELVDILNRLAGVRKYARAA